MTTLSGLPRGEVEALPVDGDGPRTKKDNAATGASAAGMRAVTARAVAFYFRAPVKAFFRTRVDYMGFARAVNPYAHANAGWSWKLTTPGILAYAVKEYGWGFILNQVLPPLLANVVVGGVLYTSYLQVLGAIHEPSSRSTKRVYPPASFSETFTAGFAAGTIQSLVAAPLDALQVRFRANDMLEGRYKSMWQYAAHKLSSIGLRGVFAGWSLSFLKDSFGSGIFFGTFEYIKSQCYYDFITSYYGHRYAFLSPGLPGTTPSKHLSNDGSSNTVTIRPHYTLEPTFLLLAGVTASVAQQAILHPLTILQNLHYNRLEALDHAAAQESGRRSIMRLYYHAYQKTLTQCRLRARRAGGWRRFLYGGFWGSTLRQVPSTSAGLIVFEVFRRRYALDAEMVRLEKDGFDLLLA